MPTKTAEPCRQMMFEETSVLVPILCIAPNPYQPAGRLKFTPEDIEKMAASIREHGLLQLPVVRINKDSHNPPAHPSYQMGDGWLRLRGYQYLSQEKKLKGYNAIPVMVRDLTDRQMADLVMEANTVRKDLSPIDLAKFYKRYLEDFKITQEELAKLHNVSQGEIANTLRLLDLPEDIQQQIISREISETAGRCLLQLNKSPKEQAKLIKEIKEERLPVRRLEEEVRRKLWDVTQSLCVVQYGDNNPSFDLAACAKCEHREELRSPWGAMNEKKPRCGDPKCWNEKQNAALQEQHKALLAKLAGQGITRIVQMDWAKMETLRGDGPSKDCQACDKRAAVKGYSDSTNIVCTDKSCHKSFDDAKRKADQEAQRKEEEKTEKYVEKVFAELDPSKPEALRTTIECLLAVIDDVDSVVKFIRGFDLFEVKLDENGEPETDIDSDKLMAAIARKYEADRVIGRDMLLRMISRLAFEALKSGYNSDGQDNERLLNAFKACRRLGVPVPPVKESKLVPGSPELPCDTCANSPTCDRSHFYVDEDGKDVCEVKVDIKHPEELNALFPDLSKLVIHISQEEGKHHSFKLGDIEVHGKSLIGCTVALAKRLSLTASDKPKDAALALRAFPVSRNRDLLVSFLEGEKGNPTKSEALKKEK